MAEKKITPENATFHTYSFKAGLMARLGHDVRYKLNAFEVVMACTKTPAGEECDVKGKFEPKSFQVLGSIAATAAAGGANPWQKGPYDTFDAKGEGKFMEHDPKSLSDGNKATIIKQIHKDLLECHKFGDVLTLKGKAVQAKGSNIMEFKGDLNMHGVTAPVEFPIKAEGKRLKAYYRMDSSQWKVKQFSAAMGALKTQEKVHVSFDFPDPR